MARVKRRRYRSPKREAQARETRGRILEAAHRLFVGRGYEGTTIREIAAKAGVAEQTVYGVFGDKPSILWAVLERLLTGEEEPVPLAEARFVQALRAEPDPRERLRVAVGWGTGDLLDRGITEVLEVIFRAAKVDPRFQAFVHEMLRRRHGDSLMLTDVISGGGAHLRPDVSVEEAADLMEAIVNPSFYNTLINERGWSKEKFQHWVLRIAEWLFFGDAPEPTKEEP